jgi:predicted amidohydrolase YtcJ
MRPNKKADTVFFNGKIVTLDSNDTIAKAVAVKDGRILAVGSDEEVKKAADSTTSLIDLGGKTMLPGFIDSHTHLGPASLNFRYNVDGRCPPNKSVSDILERIRQRVKETPKGEWIVTTMSMFADLKLTEKRFPTKDELDIVAPEHPVLILASLHTQVVNTYGLKLANITKETSDPPGGKIELDETTGQPTGILRECNKLLPIPPFSYEQFKETARDLATQYWVKQGLTTVCSFADARELRVYQELFNEKSLPLRVQAMPMDRSLGSDPMIESLVTLGIQSGLGNDWLKIGGVKIKIDGALMGLSAATHEPYLNVPGKEYRGELLINDPHHLSGLVFKAHNAGLQLCVHAIGDKAQDWALDAYENALTANPRVHRHRIEHLGNLMTNSERIRRAKTLGIVPITQVEWLYEKGDFIEWYLGSFRRDQSWPLRSMLDAGLKVANSSDTVGAAPLSVNPFFSMWCAVRRQTFFGKRLIPEEAISVKEALHLYTKNAAYACMEEHLKGSIEPDKLADLIVIDRDILTIPEEQIKDIKVDMSIIDGKIVYDSNLDERGW